MWQPITERHAARPGSCPELLINSGQQSCHVQRPKLRGVLGLEWRVDRRSFWLELVARQGLAADLAVDVLGDPGVVLQEVAGVLAALAELGVAVGKESARLLDQ